MISKKGQSGFEFMILVGFMLMGFTIFFVIIQDDRNSKLNELENDQIKEIGLSVKNEIDLAFESSEGYVREFELPRYEFGGNYSIQVVENLVLVCSDDLKLSVSYSVYPVTGDIKQYGINVIKKEDGEVKLNV